MLTVPPPHGRVQAALDAFGTGLRVQVFAQPTDTATAAADAAGCELGQIVKSLLFLADGRPLLLLVAGDRKAETALLAPLLGVPRKRIKLAAADEVARLTGYEVGGVPPVGHAQPIETLIDSSLARFQRLYAAAGTGNAVFAVSPAELLRITGGRLADISS